MPNNTSSCGAGATRPRPALRSGFSSGTAATAAAVAALRCLIYGISPQVVAVRLPSGVYLPAPVALCAVQDGVACASVIKDGGDDPDVTNGAEIIARVAVFRLSHGKLPAREPHRPEIIVFAGRGIGVVTKPGLPALPGEPAINPTPRRMLSENITSELLRSDASKLEELFGKASDSAGTTPAQGKFQHRMEAAEGKALLRLPLYETGNLAPLSRFPHMPSILVEIEAPEGENLARRTLNPRLGISGGLSILGTTGIVRPFSHEAYEQTIQAAISVAASNGSPAVVLSTGGKSERFARGMFPRLPAEAFVQIADFFSFAVQEAVKFGFSSIIHSVFFGKAVKMALGHPYTHAHAAPMDLELLAAVARDLGHDSRICAQLVSANTAMHALHIITDNGARDIVEAIARKAAEQSSRICGGASRIRLLLYDYDGKILADIKHTEPS